MNHPELTDVLSSDVLEEQFGPTGITVLYQSDAVRVICTRVLSSGQCLELSRVNFVDSGAKSFPAVHRAVMAGESMGKAFRQAGVQFIRQEQSAYHRELPPVFGLWFGKPGAATVVAVSVLAGPDRLPYAEILETYSPLVRWPDLHGQPAATQLAAIKSLDDFLKTSPTARS